MTFGRVQAIVLGILQRLGIVSGSGAYTPPDLASVLAEGNSAAGPILLGDGTAAAPSYSFEGEPDTGMYRGLTGGNSINFVHDGAEFMMMWVYLGQRLLNFGGEFSLLSAGASVMRFNPNGQVWLGNLAALLGHGSGSPEGAIAAPVGSIYLRTGDGGAGSTLYVKESGTGNTGWVAK